MASRARLARAARPGRGLRALGWFWAALLGVGAAGAIALQVSGPPPAPSPGTRKPAALPAGPAPTLPPLRPAPSAGASNARTGASRPIAAPQAALLEESGDFPGKYLPRISDDRRSPMLVYAAAADTTETRPRIAILIAGLGLSQADSRAAIQRLPGAISFAVSPYAERTGKILDEARARGHELLVSVPMEPKGFPIDNAGQYALLTGNPEAENMRSLQWAMTRLEGYVGATDALGEGLHGDRFASSNILMRPVLAQLARRGLLYVEARPGAPRPPGVVGRDADVVLDDPANAATIAARLAQLEQAARARGSAIGLADFPEPILVNNLAAWADTLAGKGIALMPVSAVVPMVPSPPGNAATGAG